MDDFPGLLARDFGFKPQGKSAPMAPPRNPTAPSHGVRSSNSYFSDKSSAPIFDDHDRGDDVFGKYSEHASRSGPPSSFDYDSIFKDQNAKSSSGPVFDKPLYDDEEGDVFDRLPGLKTASAGPAPPRFDDVFASIGSSPKLKAQKSSSSSPLDDLLGNLRKKETAEQTKRPSSRADSPAAAFEDLLPGFGRSSSPSVSRSTSVPSQSQKASSDLGRTDSPVREDPFVVLQSAPSAPPSNPGLFTDPLEQIGKFSSTGRTNVDNSRVNKGIFDDLDPLESLGRSMPPISSEINERGSVKSPLRSTSTFDSYPPTTKETIGKYPLDDRKGHLQREVPVNNFHEPSESVYDVPGASTDFHKSPDEAASSPSYIDASGHERNFTTRSEGVSEPFDDIWLTVSEIPLFTHPTSAPPPARPPPPRPPRISKSETGSFSSFNSRRKVHEYGPFSNSSPYSQVPSSARSEMNPASSQLDELDDFAMGRTRDSVGDNGDVFYGDDVDTSSAAASAAAMKEAMDKAEAKLRQVRERETLKASRIKEAVQVDKDMQETQQRELRERQERTHRERQQKEREEEEREQRRLEKEREREEKEREQRRLEREREKARQVVERATREARERAATEARLKAERAAVGKAAAEARGRAERAAVLRAQAEARERAAAEAKERAERAAAEARERANFEARESEAMEKAAAAKAEAEARRRAERAAVERAAAEARQRAAAEAHERAAAAARAQQRSDNQTKNENDLESFFSRASSASRSRDPFFDTVSVGSEASRSSSVGFANDMRKASSTSNFVDDLSSIFGGATQGGEFQEVEGETEERRRARLERHQRTQERAAKALAEKNQRDLQVQREQAERHRIAETLDVEIKRWAAGKEGNLRALLSTLQYVLWPECGWQPVSLTDLITAAAVKKVYRKATLCIHPDKVQQKGATLQQKYVAEKVFDLLKEAWNKFNSEELF